MKSKGERFPLGTGTALFQSDETMGSYMGLTREQKREMLTHAITDASGQTALLRGEMEQRK